MLQAVPRTIDGYQALPEVRSVPDATVLDYVAGGLNAGANAINDLVDIVGGPERAEWLVGGIQAAIYGVPKTAVDLAVGKLIEPGVSFVAGKISGVLKTDVFSYQASPESAEVLSDTLGGMTAEMVFGKARGVVSNSQGYAVEKGGTYVLKNEETGRVVRSGRTNDIERREREHFRNPELRDYTFEPVHRTDVYVEQRGLEHKLHEAYAPPLNKIRPVSPANPRLPSYLDAADEFLRRGN